MKIYIYSDTSFKRCVGVNSEQMTDVIERISATTDTDGLINSIYLINQNSMSGGIAYVRNWRSPAQFVSSRGRWKFTKKFPLPDDLPDQFKLIRLLFGLKKLTYPLQQQDCYGWDLHYQSFLDHFAFLFAHELHHFRRYHLNMHEREGENSANKWAISTVKEFGFKVEGSKVKNNRKKQNRRGKWTTTRLFENYKKFHDLDAGDKLIIKYDPSGRYQNQVASVIRPIRKNSRRIVVKTKDGKNWRWPMDWVSRLN